MKITVNQKDRRISVELRYKKYVDIYLLDKADDLLLAIDKFIKKRKINFTLFGSAKLEIKQASLLTERIIRAILQALRCFSNDPARRRGDS